MTVIGNGMHLKILNSQLDDTGRYTVRLENQHGAVECSAHLIVRGIFVVKTWVLTLNLFLCFYVKSMECL